MNSDSIYYLNILAKFCYIPTQIEIEKLRERKLKKTLENNILLIFL